MTWSRRELILAASVLLPTALVSRPGLSEGAGKRASIGKVDDLEGPAFRRNGQNLSPLHKGDPIFGDDELITGAGAKLQVRLGDGSILLLGAETSCLLASLALPSHEAAGDGLIVMGGGILRVILQGGGTWQSLSVESTTAIASGARHRLPGGERRGQYGGVRRDRLGRGRRQGRRYRTPGRRVRHRRRGRPGAQAGQSMGRGAGCPRIGPRRRLAIGADLEWIAHASPVPKSGASDTIRQYGPRRWRAFLWRGKSLSACRLTRPLADTRASPPRKQQ